MKMHPQIKVYGSLTYRDTKTAKEDQEAMTLVNQVKKRYPYLLFMHIKNEGKKTKAQADFDKAMGMLAGASDFVFLGTPPLLLEMKRKDNTLSTWQPNQQMFLLKAQEQGCKVCVALGWEAAMEAVEDWMRIKK